MANSLPSVFISYNPKSDFEKTLAFRLHTLGAVHGYKVSLPDRTAGARTTSPETRLRIQASEYFILFSTSKLSKIVEEEIAIAWEKLHDKSRIVIIYDGVTGGKNLTGTEHCTEIFVDSDRMGLQEITNLVIQKLNQLNYSVVPRQTNGKKANNENVLAGLLVAGLGLLLLGALLQDEK
jgi:hypothetical protein